MELFFIIIIIFLIFSVYLITQVIQAIVYIVINTAILWVVLLRAYFEIRYQKRFYPYLYAFIITTIIHLIWFDKIQIPNVFWPVWFVTMIFLFAQIIKFIPEPYRRWVQKKTNRAVNETQAILKRL